MPAGRGLISVRVPGRGERAHLVVGRDPELELRRIPRVVELRRTGDAVVVEAFVIDVLAWSQPERWRERLPVGMRPVEVLEEGVSGRVARREAKPALVHVADELDDRHRGGA